jgi:4-nitrophenyl phosphatase
MPAQRLSTKAEYEALLDKYDTWLFDCDGVLWHGDGELPGASAVLGLLRARGKAVLFVTNNATKSRAAYKKKFDGLGIQVAVVRPAARVP